MVVAMDVHYYYFMKNRNAPKHYELIFFVVQRRKFFLITLSKLLKERFIFYFYFLMGIKNVFLILNWNLINENQWRAIFVSIYTRWYTLCHASITLSVIITITDKHRKFEENRKKETFRYMYLGNVLFMTLFLFLCKGFHSDL